MKHLLIFALIFTSFSFNAPQANAGACFSDPIHDHAWSGTVTTGARVRDVACMEGSTVVTTLPVGSTINIVGETDGWWKVQTSEGEVGWVGQWLIRVDDKSKLAYTPGTPEPELYDEPEPEPKETTAPSTSILSRTKGYILLQVQNHGEAWYVHPDTGYRYYMKDGPTAYEMMRSFGLGMSEKDFKSLDAGNYEMNKKLRGKIVLRVELHGEAYYIHPKDGSLNYLKDGAAAYTIMRYLSLGITNSDLAGITAKEIPLIPYSNPVAANESPEPEPSTPAPVATTNSGTISISAAQSGSIPAGVDTIALNEYWLAKVNALRAARGLRQLVLDQRWVDTASDYAGQMYANQWFGHERADGGSMHDWIDEQGLPFTERYSEPDGWQSNYFTENISWDIAAGSMAGAMSSLDNTMDFYLAEASYNGPHYRTTYHEDWNSVGVGFYFQDKGNGKYKVYMVFHYGSLVQ